MGQVLHPCAKTTQATRRAIQNSEESLMVLARRYGINPKTVAKWRARKDEGALDRKMGAKMSRSVLSATDEAIICEFRRQTRLPLDDCYDVLKEQIPQLSRSNLHRCLQRHGLSRLPKEEQDAAPKKQFKDYPIGFVHVDISNIHVGSQKLYLFVGICRVSKYAFAEVFESMTTLDALAFLDNLIKACPFKIHTILTDNGPQFTYIKNIVKRGKGPAKRHRFDLACQKHGIRHKITQPYRPQTNGQVERMNRTLKDATTKRYYYENVEQLKRHLESFLMAYNCAKKLSALKRKTPYEAILFWWDKQPKLFNINPLHHWMGLNT
ncbi:IS481 family transposase [Methylophaga sp. OBS4]|uniref:IS481 family transposase n=1 Tax=Methylophaga sp. OBS4 TaxID=2991935 RepID=UPI00224D7F99|nr:IS481 family transposase [Methylophaga sp. OBS4]MCX4187384.1 IS481 family transposase [Methylophaga sp. OBS4]